MNEAAMRSTKVFSANGLKNFFAFNGNGRGGIRDRTVRLARMSRPSWRNATIRIAQPKPTSGMSLFTMIGRITPPSPDPAATIPTAKARFFKNHEMAELVAGLNRQQMPIGLQIP
jgi:hypothetical protein